MTLLSKTTKQNSTNPVAVVRFELTEELLNEIVLLRISVTNIAFPDP